MKAKLLCLFFLILISSTAYSQERVLQLRLNTGLWDGLSYFDEDFNSNPPNIRAYYRPVLNWLFGASVELKIDSTWRFGLGIQENLYASHHQIVYDLPLGERRRLISISHSYFPGLSLYATRRLKTWKFSSQREGVSKWSIGLEALADFQFLFPPKEFSTFSIGTPDTDVETNVVATRKHKVGGNIRLGFAFNLMKRGKDVLMLEAFYAQGLRELVSTRVDYRVQNVESAVIINSRATSFGINLGIPIRIVSWNKK